MRLFMLLYDLVVYLFTLLSFWIESVIIVLINIRLFIKTINTISKHLMFRNMEIIFVIGHTHNHVQTGNLLDIGLELQKLVFICFILYVNFYFHFFLCG